MRSCLFILFSFSITASSQEMRLVLPIGHTAGISQVEYSPDGRFILTAAEDGGMKLWEAITGKLLRDYTVHSGRVNSVRFSADGKNFISSSNDGSAKVLETITGKVLREFNGHENSQVVSAQTSPDGKQVMTAADRYLFIWEASTGKLLDKIGAHGSSIVDAFYSKDGKKIFSASWDHSARVWNAENGTLLHDLKGHRDWITSMDLSASGKYLLTASEDSTARVWEIETGRLVHELKAHKDEVLMAGFSSNDVYIATASKDRTAIVWDANTGKQITTLTGHVQQVNHAVFSTDNQRLLTVSADRTVKVWKVQDGRLLMDWQKHINQITKGRFSPDGRSFATASADWTSVVWDLASGNPRLHLRGYSSTTRAGGFSDDGKSLLTMSESGIRIWNTKNGMLRSLIRQPDGYIRHAELLAGGERLITMSGNHSYLWDVNTAALLSRKKIRSSALGYSFSPDGKYLSANFRDGVELHSLDDDQKVLPVAIPNPYGQPIPIFSAGFSPDSKLFALACADGIARIIDPSTGKLVQQLHGHQRELTGVIFSPDSKRVFSFSLDGSGKLWDLATGQVLVTVMHFSSAFGAPHLVFSPDGRQLAHVHYTSVTLFDMQTGKRSAEMSGHTDEITYAAFSPDGKKMITASKDNSAKVWDVASGTRLVNLKGHEGLVNYAGFSAGGDKIVTTSNDNMTKLWSPQGDLLYSFFATADGYFLQAPSKHYLASPGAARLLHYVTPEMNTVSFEQLDVKYNRPDIVIASIGQEDTALIRSYKKAYDKRIKKLGIDTTRLHSNIMPPRIEISNLSFTGYETRNRNVKIRIRARDSITHLQQLHVWINDVPLYGTAGISFGKRKPQAIDTILQLQLSNGENHITASVFNANGTESFRMPLFLKLEATDTSKVYFIGIGIDRFAEAGHDLDWSVKDIRDLAGGLKNKYSNIIIDTLLNEQVTVSNVTALKARLKHATVDDKVIIAYSGHGLLSKQFDYYLSTFPMQFDDPARNGLPYETVEGLLDGIAPRKKLLLIDACHSGEVDKEEMEKYVLVEKTLEDSGTKSGRKPVQTNGTLGMKNSFELMQELFVNVGRSTGATIISAAAGTQFAQEKADLQNGVFTYSILEYMKSHPQATVTELRQYVNKRVSELTNGMQVPTTRSETKAVDWFVWE